MTMQSFLSQIAACYSHIQRTFSSTRGEEDKASQQLINLCGKYRKIPKIWDVRNLRCNLPKTVTKRPNLKGILSKWCKWDSKQ